MTEVRTSSLCERPCAGIEETGKAPSDAGGIQPSPISATHIGKRLAGKLHEPFERAGGGRAISPTSPDSTATKPPNKAGRPAAEAVERRAEAKENANRCRTCRTQGRESVSQVPERVRKAEASRQTS